jgi:hypothetical protein
VARLIAIHGGETPPVLLAKLTGCKKHGSSSFF